MHSVCVCVCVCGVVGGVVGEWAKPGEQSLVACFFFQLGRHCALADRLESQGHEHGKDTAISLGPLAVSSHCPSSAPEETAVSRIPHVLLLGPCLSSTANLPRSFLWQPQKHRFRGGQRA